MARLEYTSSFASREELYEDYGDNTTLIHGSNPDAMSFVANGNLEVMMRGEDFDLGSTLNAGMLESITFRSIDGDVTARIRGLKLDITDQRELFAYHPPDIQGIVEFALSGADQIIGSARGEALYGYGGRDVIKAGGGRDEIHGGAGKDRLTGGKGSDHFVFDNGSGKDVITDFDARGGGAKQDYIILEDYADVRIYKAGKHGQDTLIRYGDGLEILLEDVHRSDVKMDVDIIFAV